MSYYMRLEIDIIQTNMAGFSKTLNTAKAEALEAWRKFVCPTARRGGTVHPNAPKDQERGGVR